MRLNTHVFFSRQVLYGEDVAILAGDALLSQAFQHVAENTKGVDPERVLDVVVHLGKSVGPVGLAGGQVMDLHYRSEELSDLAFGVAERNKLNDTKIRGFCRFISWMPSLCFKTFRLLCYQWHASVFLVQKTRVNYQVHDASPSSRVCENEVTLLYVVQEINTVVRQL